MWFRRSRVRAPSSTPGRRKRKRRKTKALCIHGYVRFFRFLRETDSIPTASRLPPDLQPPARRKQASIRESWHFPVQRSNPPTARTGPLLAVGVIPTPKEARKTRLSEAALPHRWKIPASSPSELDEMHFIFNKNSFY